MPYLIVTNIKEFWSDNDSSIMLGPWCVPLLEDGCDIKIDNIKMISCLWKDAIQRQQAYSETQQLYNNILVVLSKSLNKMHNKNYSERFWTLVVGPWVNYFAQVVYDRFTRLKIAKELYSNLTVLGLNSENKITPIINTYDFVLNVKYNDLYNLKLTTSLAEKMSMHTILKSFNTSNINLSDKIFSNSDKKISFKAKINRAIQDKFFSNANVVLYHTGHEESFLAKIFILSNGKIVHKPKIYPMLCNIKIDLKKREKFKELLLQAKFLIKTNQLESAALDLLIEEFPLVFLEGYSNLEENANSVFVSCKPKAIFSSIGWYYDEHFKCWSAMSAEYGAKLYGLQHGGNYGVISNLDGEDHEIYTLDGFLSWGWKYHFNKKITPSPAQKLINIKKRVVMDNAKYKEILFCATILNRYPVQFGDIPENFQKYFDWQVIFLKSISINIRSLIRLRLHYEEHTWKMKKNLQVIFPDLIFDTYKNNFRDSLYNCRLFVCDHLSTTYIEALAANIPTVLFWNSEITTIVEPAQPYFESFRNVGILHDTPESAAVWIEKIYDNIDSWWMQKDCQDAVNNFCNNYARTSKSPVSDWLKIIKELSS